VEKFAVIIILCFCIFKANWVIHFDQSVLETLGSWHQKTFADIADSGNGLLADVLKSKLTKEQVEDELLALIKRHCPPKTCPLAGSSIHIDKHVLQLRMPRVHDYLHYRIIDVSSFQGIMRRWAPWVEADIKKRLAKKGQETVNHRAMDDIEWSIAFMREFRPILARQRK
jgi:oligoribonuclease